MTYAERRKRNAMVLKYLANCAKKGLPCPTNLDIMDLIGALSSSTANKIVADLEKAGEIIVHRTSNDRRIELPTGECTGGIVRQQRNKTEKVQSFNPLPAVDRTPCGWCGVRADIGCHHSRRMAA